MSFVSEVLSSFWWVGVSIQDAISVHSGTHGLLIGTVFESIWSRDPGKGGWNAVNRMLGL